MTRTLSPSDRSIAAGIAQATAHGITRIGMAHLEGEHLSEAPNESTPRPFAHKIRAQQLSDARVLIRSAGITDERELFQALSNIHAACVHKDDWFAQKLSDLLCDMDTDLNSHEPELPQYGSERGEFDAATVAVRGRG